MQKNNVALKDYSIEEREFVIKCLDSFIKNKDITNLQVHNNFSSILVSRDKERTFKVGFTNAVGNDNEEDFDDDNEG